jgi:hypothetical protein
MLAFTASVRRRTKAMSRNIASVSRRELVQDLVLAKDRSLDVERVDWPGCLGRVRIAMFDFLSD